MKTKTVRSLIAKLFLSLLVSVPLILSACSDDSASSTTQLSTTPTALAAYDNSSAGIYKGIVVGSSGHFELKIKNGSDTIACYFVFDGVSDTLTSTSLANWTPGQAITNAIFTGSLNGVTVTLTFSCGATGSNPTVVVTIPGHTTYVSITKETSTMLVECYEGTYVQHTSGGNINGKWDFISYGGFVKGYHVDDTGNGGEFAGTISGTTLTIGEDILTISGQKVSGAIYNSDNEQISVAGKRTW